MNENETPTMNTVVRMAPPEQIRKSTPTVRHLHLRRGRQRPPALLTSIRDVKPLVPEWENSASELECVWTTD